MSYQMRQLLYLLGLIIVLFALWNTVILYPLRILVVFFHESSHAIATVLSGGTVKEMVVEQAAGGHVLSYGGNRFITLSAGYLGSLTWGLVIFLVAVGTHWDRILMAVLGAALTLITVLYVKNMFAYGFGIGVGAIMIASSRLLNTDINDLILRTIGMTSILYVPLDIYSDTIARSHLRSDARMLAEEVGGTTLVWGSLWLFASIVMIYLCFRWTLKLNPDTLSEKDNVSQP